jgi:DNA polymerase-1
LKEVKHGEDYAIDTETQGFDPFTKKLLLIQIATRDSIYIFDARKITKEVMRNYIEYAFAVSNRTIFHNAKFDLKFLMHNYDFVPPIDRIYDTMLCEGILYNGLTKPNGKSYAFTSLNELAQKYLNVELDKDTRQLFIDYEEDYFTEEMLEYSAKDVQYLFDIVSAQQYFLIKNELLEIARIENNLVPVIASMELNGVLLDTTEWLKIYEQVVIDQQKLLIEIQDLASEIKVSWPGIKSAKPKDYDFSVTKFNPGSWQQTLAIFYARGVKLPRRTYKNGKEIVVYETLDTSDSKVLEKLDDEMAKKIIEYRALGKLAGSYGINIIELINPATGRIHGQFNQLGPASGRLSSENPNLQNIPVRLGAQYRNCFIVPKGYKQITPDFPNIEMRLAGEFSGDQMIINAYLNDEDLHAVSASAMYGVPLEEVTKSQRSTGKTFNFSVLYGAQAYTVSTRLEIPQKDAEILITNWRAKFSGLSSYLESTKDFLLENGYVKTFLGRRRYFEMPSPTNPNYKRILSANIREACNHPIQGTSADMTKISLINIFYRIQGYDAKIIRTVHDEITVECKEEIAEGIANIMKQEMEKAAKIFLKIIPVVVEAEPSDRWEH